MSSRQKRKIAGQNGAKAAGSKSPEGLQKSSMNALRHGLTAMALVLSNESQAKFDHMLQSYIARFKPVDEIEPNLVGEMVAAHWRQQRIWMIQTASMNSEMDKQEEYKIQGVWSVEKDLCSLSSLKSSACGQLR
jgi:hypothetical protein